MPVEPKICEFPDCGRPNFAYGLCATHAKQKRLGQDLRPIRAARPSAPPGQAWCSRCKQFLAEEFFSPDKARGCLQRICRPCRAEYMRDYNNRPTKDGHTHAGKQREYVERNKDRISRQITLRRWGITEEQYAVLENHAGGICGVCKKPPRERKSLCLDHNHLTGKVYGLVCQDCNLGMGQLWDDSNLMRAAADWKEIGGNLPPELQFSVDPETHGQARTDIRRRARIVRA